MQISVDYKANVMETSQNINGAWLFRIDKDMKYQLKD